MKKTKSPDEEIGIDSERGKEKLKNSATWEI
jgi:hypothetical protein